MSKMSSNVPPLLLRKFTVLSALMLPLLASLSQTSYAQINILTQRYDNSRSGRNWREAQLNVSNVNQKQFGKLFSRSVDGEIYAQPLIVSGVDMSGQGKRNVVYIATEHNSVYAFDAEDPEAHEPLWQVQMGTPVPTSDVGQSCGVYKDFSKEIGITGTPVIDRASNTLYVVARTKVVKPGAAATTGPATPTVPAATPPAGVAPVQGSVGAGVVTVAANQQDVAPTAPAAPVVPAKEGEEDEKNFDSVIAILKSRASYHQYLHAIDIRTGKERSGSPLEIKAQVPGKGQGAVGGILKFDPLVHNQRPGLLLHNGVVYISWGGHCDTGPYHGWIIGYNAKTLKQTGAFCTTPNGLGAGIWQSGIGPIVDEKGQLYLVNGNGTVDTDRPSPRKTEYGSSFLKLQTKGGKITVADWFTPYNYTSLNDADLDTGSTSLLPIPGSKLMVAGSKAGVIYVVDRDKLGGFDMFGDKQIVQHFKASKGFLYSTPLLWEHPNGRPWLFSWGMDDRLKAFEWDGKRFKTEPVSQSSEKIVSPRPGAFLSLSSLGDDPRTSILWALQPLADANQAVVTGVLRAFDASDLRRELWNSRINLSRDDVGKYAKFCPPIVANGRVYVASFSGELHVYGLNPPAQAQAPTIVSRTGSIADFVTIENDQSLVTIRYTTDGSNPTSTSERYRTPFKMEKPGRVLARAFRPGLLPSPVASATLLDPGIKGTGNGLLGTYFFGTDLQEEAFQRIDGKITNLPPGRPDNNNWSVRWTGQIQATHTGNTTFTTFSDDGVRLWVDGKLLIDNWNVHGATQDNGVIALEAGKKYDFKMEYYQGNLGSICRLLWTPPGQPQEIIPQSQFYTDVSPLFVKGSGTGLTGRYFANTKLEGPSLQRIDAQLNDNPRPEGLGPDDWSARWIGQVLAPSTGTYTFSTFTDDGIRLWVDGKLLFENWTVHGGTQNNGTVFLQAGKKYDIKIEYYQGKNGWNMRLLWTPPGGEQELIPQPQLYPTSPNEVTPEEEGDQQ